MKKNLATIILIAMVFVNMTLSIVLVFAVVPSASKTNRLVTKVMQILDLEVEDEEPVKELLVEDIEVYPIEDKITVNLAKSTGDNSNHFAVIEASLSLNKTASDYTKKQPLVSQSENVIKECIGDACGKYTHDIVQDNKEAIKAEILKSLQEYFQSDFIVGISFGSFVVQ